MKKPVFEGVATALVTPFKQGTVDFAVMNQLLDLQLAAGVDAVGRRRPMETAIPPSSIRSSFVCGRSASSK